MAILKTIQKILLGEKKPPLADRVRLNVAIDGLYDYLAVVFIIGGGLVPQTFKKNDFSDGFIEFVLGYIWGAIDCYLQADAISAGKKTFDISNAEFVYRQLLRKCFGGLSTEDEIDDFEKFRSMRSLFFLGGIEAGGNDFNNYLGHKPGYFPALFSQFITTYANREGAE
jgi:hypothetical protein